MDSHGGFLIIIMKIINFPTLTFVSKNWINSPNGRYVTDFSGIPSKIPYHIQLATFSLCIFIYPFQI